MTEEEQKNHYKNTELYRQQHPEIYRSAALKYYYNNKEKCADKAKQWRIKNKEYAKIRQREGKRKRKEQAIDYLGGVCFKCGGVFHPSVFEFHHKDPTSKGDRDPSKYLSLKWETIVEELNKCMLLCANCHRLIHHQENYD